MTLTGYLDPFPVADLTSPRVTVVWVDPLGLASDIPAPPETLHFASDPAGGFTVQLFAPPPSIAATGTFVAPGTPDVAVRFAFGEIVLYEDFSGETSFMVSAGNDMVGPDDYRGATATYALIYISQLIDGANAGRLWPILMGPPGYHLGAVDCENFGSPVIDDVDPAAAVLDMQVLPPSTQLPYVRMCLRSHSAPVVGS